MYYLLVLHAPFSYRTSARTCNFNSARNREYSNARFRFYETVHLLRRGDLAASFFLFFILPRVYLRPGEEAADGRNSGKIRSKNKVASPFLPLFFLSQSTRSRYRMRAPRMLLNGPLYSRSTTTNMQCDASRS